MNQSRVTIKACLLAGSAILALGPLANAHAFDDNDMFAAEAQIEYRQGVMRAIGGNTGALGAILIEGADEYRGNLEKHARFIKEMTEDIPSLFPEGSDFGDTDALDAVWEDREAFEEKARENHEAAVAFLRAVEEDNEDEIGQRFRELGESCSSCHDDFRAE